MIIAAQDYPPDWHTYFTERPKPVRLNTPHVLAGLAREAFTALLGDDNNNATLLDPSDLLHQCLLRLFSYSPHEYLRHGHIIQKDWVGVSYDELEGSAVTFDETLLQAIYQEQRLVLANEYYQPEAHLFADLSSLFARSDRGRIEILNGKPYIVSTAGLLEFELREVKTQLATRIMRSFHPVHSPRESILALGLHARGYELPFSVLTISSIDREYRRAALCKYDIHPDHTYEFARLYNVPNAPQNTSSYMFTLAVSRLQRDDRQWQAAISSFLPSYFKGSAMLGGSFDQALFARPFHHLYETSQWGVIARTSRTSPSTPGAVNQTRIMPVVELIRANRKYAARIENSTTILVYNH